MRINKERRSCACVIFGNLKPAGNPLVWLTTAVLVHSAVICIDVPRWSLVRIVPKSKYCSRFDERTRVFLKSRAALWLGQHHLLRPLGDPISMLRRRYTRLEGTAVLMSPVIPPASVQAASALISRAVPPAPGKSWGQERRC